MYIYLHSLFLKTTGEQGKGRPENGGCQLHVHWRVLYAGVMDSSLLYLHLQMLLCVGLFFNNTPECQQQWKEYVDGREKGKEKHILVPKKSKGGLRMEAASCMCIGVRCVYVVLINSTRHDVHAYSH